jgi:hypothetical protein
MVVVHVASDAFVGTVPQVVTVNVNLIVACCNLLRCNGFCVCVDKDNSYQRLHRACTGGPLHVQTSVVHGT